MREPTAEQHEENQTEDHPHPRRTKSPVPARFRIEAVVNESLLEALTLREVTADEWRQHCTDVDAHVKDRKPAITTRIIFTVETTDHRADVWLEETGAGGDEHHAEIERRHRIEDHREVTGSDDQSAEKDGQARAQEIVGRESARERGYIHTHRVRAVDRGGALYVETQTAVFRKLRHIKDKNGAHPVIAEALPHLGKEERTESFRMSDESRVAKFWFEFGLCRHDCAAI